MHSIDLWHPGSDAVTLHKEAPSTAQQGLMSVTPERVATEPTGRCRGGGRAYRMLNEQQQQ